MKFKNVVAIAVFLLVIVQGQFLLAQTITDDKDLGDFIRFRTRLFDKISAKERSGINFSIAEYYFKTNDFSDARRAFKEYVDSTPAGISTLVAKAYLYKFANQANEQENAEAIKKEMFEKQFILLFDKYKTLNYVSRSGNRYEVHYYVDKIEIFLNGEIFEQISP